ncbi:unnamed protein product [Acanthosepion pharaonis]|uniref:Uncharacterized protein n=1 Tax=Acanthosepion pharaonis TaxID=158019 RepID=A0A812CTU3_ACAPH|nr:unnamed protein product [Sepia pharaonis]
MKYKRLLPVADGSRRLRRFVTGEWNITVTTCRPGITSIGTFMRLSLGGSLAYLDSFFGTSCWRDGGQLSSSTSPILSIPVAVPASFPDTLLINDRKSIRLNRGDGDLQPPHRQDVLRILTHATKFFRVTVTITSTCSVAIPALLFTAETLATSSNLAKKKTQVVERNIQGLSMQRYFRLPVPDVFVWSLTDLDVPK